MLQLLSRSHVIFPIIKRHISTMDYVRKTVVENLSFGSLFAKGDEKFTHEQIPDQSGKVALITGGTEGIGFGCSHALLKNNISKLYLISLSKEIADGAI